MAKAIPTMHDSPPPDGPMRGTIKWFNAEKGYGFIRPQDGSSDVFLHITVLKRANLDNPPEGAEIVFEMVEAQKGRQASRVVTIDAAAAASNSPRRGPRRTPEG